MIRAVSYFQMPGRSWPREMRPLPIAPTLMRLLGERGAEHGRRHDRREAGQDGCRDEAGAGRGEELAPRRGAPRRLSKRWHACRSSTADPRPAAFRCLFTT